MTKILQKGLTKQMMSGKIHIYNNKITKEYGQFDEHITPPEGLENRKSKSSKLIEMRRSQPTRFDKNNRRKRCEISPIQERFFFLKPKQNVSSKLIKIERDYRFKIRKNRSDIFSQNDMKLTFRNSSKSDKNDGAILSFLHPELSSQYSLKLPNNEFQQCVFTDAKQIRNRAIMITTLRAEIHHIQ